MCNDAGMPAFYSLAIFKATLVRCGWPDNCAIRTGGNTGHYLYRSTND